jgi:hypothetical protein
MQIHSKSSGLILPLALYALWRFRKQSLAVVGIFYLASLIAVPFASGFLPKAIAPSQSSLQEANKRWRPASCQAPARPKDIQFCRQFKGL